MLSLLFACATATNDSAAPTDTGLPDDTADSAGDSDDTGDSAVDTADSGADTADSGADTADSGPSYYRDVWPVYRDVCGDCHWDWGGVASPDAVYDTLLNGTFADPFVIPGDRDASWLYDKIAHDSPADRKQRMPPATPLVDDVTLTALADWIDAGAANDDAWKGVFNNVWMNRHCHNCHEEWGQDPDTVLGNLLSETSGGMPLVDPGNHANSYVYLKIAWDPPPDYGSQMPKTFAYLDADTIEAIGLWIDAGAPDN